MPLPFFTIGHSTRTIPEFVELLRTAQVELVIDIRTIPRSRTNPHYNEGALPAALAPYQIAYRRIAALGGLRRRSPAVPPELWRRDLSFAVTSRAGEQEDWGRLPLSARSPR
jgi:uncharacterized protein (DUF488 family)